HGASDRTTACHKISYRVNTILRKPHSHGDVGDPVMVHPRASVGAPRLGRLLAWWQWGGRPGWSRYSPRYRYRTDPQRRGVGGLVFAGPGETETPDFRNPSKCTILRPPLTALSPAH